MKRILSLVLVVLLILPTALPLCAEESVISIETREDLEAIAKHPEGTYRLDVSRWLPDPPGSE